VYLVHLVLVGAAILGHRYFESIGFVKPSNMTPADFYLEISMGKIPQKTEDGGLDYNFDHNKLPDYWIEKGRYYRPTELKELPNPHDNKDDVGEEEKGDNGEEKVKGKEEQRAGSDSSKGSKLEVLINGAWSTLSDKAANEWHSIENYIGDNTNDGQQTQPTVTIIVTITSLSLLY